MLQQEVRVGFRGFRVTRSGTSGVATRSEPPNKAYRTGAVMYRLEARCLTDEQSDCSMTGHVQLVSGPAEACLFSAGQTEVMMC
jgi:hypothetical protein